MNSETKEKMFNKKGINLAWAGLGFGALYWFFESVRDVVLHNEGSLFERLFLPDAMSFWMRLLVVSILILFGIHAESHKKRIAYFYDRNRKIKTIYPSRIYLVGFSYSALYWVLESVRDSFVFGKGSIFSCIFQPGPMALWMRLLTIFIIVLFTLYYQTLVAERREIIRKFRKEQEELEKKVEERTSELTLALTQLEIEIKEKNQIRDQLFHAQKMEAIGLLAGGIAHDFGNLLQSIQGIVDTALMDIDESDEQYQGYQEILDLIKTANSVVHKIVHFSRKQPMQFHFININSIIKDSAKLINRWIGSDVTFETDLSPDLWKIHVNHTALEQVILNIAINAKDAMPEGGCFILKTENKKMDEIEYKHDENERLCDCICLSFTDTGKGMDTETLEHIFEPYYTTKNRGDGTGLGLSVVYGIVKQHNGWIKVTSEVGKGTTFRIYFPIQHTTAKDEISEPSVFIESDITNEKTFPQNDIKKVVGQPMNA